MWYFFLGVLLLGAPPFRILCPVLRKHYTVFDWRIGWCSWGGVADGRAYFGKCPKVIMFSWGGFGQVLEKLLGC
jgi:hypothetical protein